MGARFSAIGVALFYALPALLALDAAYKPAAAWHRIRRTKWRWVAIFLAPAPLGWLTGSLIPAIVISAFSAFYMAKVRSVLDAALALEIASADDPSAYPAVRHAPAAVPLIFGVPVIGFAVLTATSTTGREKVVALVFAAVGLVVTAVAVVITYRQSGDSPS